MPFACSSTKSISSSTKAWRRVGTPAVAPRTTHQIKPTPTKPSRMETISESTFSAEKPPSPRDLVKNVRWCWMYSEGVSSLAAAIFRSVIAHEKRHGKNQQGDDEGCDQRADHRLAVVHENEPEQQDGEPELYRLGPQ